MPMRRSGLKIIYPLLIHAKFTVIYIMKVTFKNIQPGDVFSFYVGNKVYAFARLLYFIEKSLYITEIFDYQSNSPEFTEGILTSSRLIPLQNVGFLII